MYAIIGWFNVAAIVIMTMPFWLRLINKRAKSKAVMKTAKVLRTVHKPLGITIVVLAFVHGLLALGTLRLHTGTVVGLLLITTAALGGAFHVLKKRRLLTAHRTVAMILLALVLVHLIIPSALWYLFRI